MGRPTLSQNKKWRRLVDALGSAPLARGCLELIWDSCYEAGDHCLGMERDVELAAQWQGEPGKLLSALRKSGFIDECEGQFYVHDFWDHAPSYVAKRYAREARRKKSRPCPQCGVLFHSSEKSATYCSGACRTAAYRVRHRGEPDTSQPPCDTSVTPSDVTAWRDDVTDTSGDEPPSPSPSPSPSPTPCTTPLPPTGGKTRAKRTTKAESQVTLVLPEPIVELANAILEATPAKQEDGTVIRRDPGKLANRLMTILDTKITGIAPEVLLHAWKLYVKSCPKAIKAPQYFFGEAEHQGANGAHWLEWARLAYRKLSSSASTTGSPTSVAQSSKEQGQVGVDTANPDAR